MALCAARSTRWLLARDPKADLDERPLLALSRYPTCLSGALATATRPEDMNLPGWDWHPPSVICPGAGR
jgi:hypothetical protein